MATNKKQKFYAVKVGTVPGIYTDWDMCKVAVHGYPGSEYKSFPTKEAAQAYLAGEEIPQELELPMENELFAYVDGSYNTQSGIYGYGVVLVFSDGHTEEQSGAGQKEAVAAMRNVAGELKGAMIAMQYAVNQKFQKLTIFHDYEGIAKWAMGEWKTNLEATASYREFAGMIQSKIELSFRKVTAHTGVCYNERADQLAKQGAGISEP